MQAFGWNVYREQILDGIARRFRRERPLAQAAPPAGLVAGDAAALADSLQVGSRVAALADALRRSADAMPGPAHGPDTHPVSARRDRPGT